MKAVIKVLHVIFLVLCLGYLAYALFQEGDEISRLFLNASLVYIIPSLLVWPVVILVGACFAHLVVTGVGAKLHYRQILAIYLNRIPAKYLPGGVWQTFARAYDLNAFGLDKKQIGILVFYENFWTVVLAALVSSVVLLISGLSVIYREFALLMLLGVLLLPVLAWFFRSNFLVLSPALYLRISVAGLLFWIVAGCSFLLYLFAFTGVLGDQSLVVLFANYLFSYVLGFVSIFTPQGIGVFEYVMTQLTEFSILESQSLILLAGFRIIVLLGDMIAWIIFLTLRKTTLFQEAGSNNG